MRGLEAAEALEAFEGELGGHGEGGGGGHREGRGIQVDDRLRLRPAPRQGALRLVSGGLVREAAPEVGRGAGEHGLDEQREDRQHREVHGEVSDAGPGVRAIAEQRAREPDQGEAHAPDDRREEEPTPVMAGGLGPVARGREREREQAAALACVQELRGPGVDPREQQDRPGDETERALLTERLVEGRDLQARPGDRHERGGDPAQVGAIPAG